MAGEATRLEAVVDAETAGFMRGMDRVDARARASARNIEASGRQADAAVQRQGLGWSALGQRASAAGRAGEAAGRRMRSGLLFAAKAASVVALGVGAIGVGALAVGVKFDVMRTRGQVAFRTMLGSTSAANRFLDQLQAFAAKTPFQFADLIPAAQRMMAMGIAAKDVLPDLQAIGDAEALLGGGKEGVDRVTLALGQMNAKTKVSAEEMRQLTEAGIPAWQFLAQAMHKSVAQVMELSQKRMIQGDFGVKAIVDGMEGRFKGGMARLNKTLEGQWSNLKDNLTSLMGGIALPLIAPLTRITTEANAVLSRLKLAPTLHAKATIVWDGIEAAAAGLMSRLDTLLHGPTRPPANPVQGGVPASTATLAGGLVGGLGATGRGASPAQGLIADLKNADWSSIGQQILQGVKAGFGTGEALWKGLVDGANAHAGDFGKVGALILLNMANAMLDPGFWAAHWQLILGIAIAAFPAGKVGKIAEKLFPGFEAAFKALGPRMKGWIGEALLSGAAKLSEYAPRLADALVTVFLAAAKIGGRIAGAAIILAKGYVETIAKAVGGFGRGLLGAALRIAIVSGVAGVIAAVAGTLLSLGQKIVREVKEGIHAAVSFIQSGLGQAIIAGVGGVPGMIAGTLAALGANIISGIVSGITSNAGRIASAIAGAVGLGGGGGYKVPIGPHGPVPGSGAGGHGRGGAAGLMVRPGEYALIGDAKQGREWAIPEDPRYRRRSLRLWMEAGQALGVPGMARGGVAGKPSAAAYKPRFNFRKWRRLGIEKQDQQAQDYDAETQRWNRYWNRDGDFTPREMTLQIKRMQRYKAMLAIIGAHSGKLYRTRLRQAKGTKDDSKRQQLLQEAHDYQSKQHDVGQSIRDLTQDIADLVQSRAGYQAPVGAQKTLDDLLKPYEDKAAIAAAGLGGNEGKILGAELAYLQGLAKHPPKGIALADIARAITDVKGRLDSGGGGGTAAEQPIQAQLDEATRKGFASGFGRMWAGLTGGLGDIGTGQGVTLAVDRLLISPNAGNYATMADGANAGNDAQSYRIYSPVKTVGAPA